VFLDNIKSGKYDKPKEEVKKTNTIKLE